MIPDDREKRIKAATEAMPWLFGGVSGHKCAARILDAADRAVPVVSATVAAANERMCNEAVLDAAVAIVRAEAAEAAARDFAQALRQISGRLDEAGCGATDPTGEHHIALNALSAHPDFAKPSKPDEEEQ